MRRNYRGTGKECVNPKPSARRVQEEQEEINDDDVMTYDRLIVLCMSKLKIYNLKDIEMMTLREFNYRMWALEYEQLDKDMEMYKLAFAIRDAQAEQKVKGGKKAKWNTNSITPMKSSIIKRMLNVLIKASRSNSVVNRSLKITNQTKIYYK